VAEVAMQSGHHAAKTIVRRARGDKKQRPFRYYDLGTAATIGRFRAIVYVGPIRVSGLAGWLAWLVIHLTFLSGFKNRFTTLAGWTIALFGRGRAQRTITGQQALARVEALERPRAASQPANDGSDADVRAA
jgi:NADH dehydrogenase